MRHSHESAWVRLTEARRLQVHGRRRYRVWWLGHGARAVCWRGSGLPAGAGRRYRRWRRGGAIALACAFGAACVDPRALAVSLVMALLVAALAWLDAPRRRERALRRGGARPGPWVWAIDATSAIQTAEIAVGVGAVRDQVRRTPSMRIQSPSCSHSSWSNQAW